MENTTERLNELEIRFTHQAHLLDELNDELIGANKRIAQLERELSGMREMLTQLAPEATESPDE